MGECVRWGWKSEGRNISVGTCRNGKRRDSQHRRVMSVVKERGGVRLCHVGQRKNIFGVEEDKGRRSRDSCVYGKQGVARGDDGSECDMRGRSRKAAKES